MTVDTKAVLTMALSAQEIVDILRSDYVSHDPEVRQPSIRSGFDRNTCQINVTDRLTGERRGIHVGLNGVYAADHENVYKGPSAYLTLGDHGDAVGIFRSLLDVTGGFLMESDAVGEWVEVRASKQHPLISIERRVESEVDRLTEVLTNHVDTSHMEPDARDDRLTAVRNALRDLMNDVITARDAKLSAEPDEPQAGPLPR